MEEATGQRGGLRGWITIAAVAVPVCGVLVWFALPGKTASDEVPPTERETVRKRIEILLEAAEQGNVEHYLGCFAEPLRSKVAREIPDAATLQRSESNLNGFVCPPDEPTVNKDEVSVVVEKIYAETSVRVRFNLRWNDDQWVITAIETLDRSAPVTIYGTPVFPLKQ